MKKGIFDKIKNRNKVDNPTKEPEEESSYISDEQLSEGETSDEEEEEVSEEVEEKKVKKQVGGEDKHEIKIEDLLLNHEKRLELLEFKTGLRTY
jgi:polyhydroxyalkanoate synthesis regulator phasin